MKHIYFFFFLLLTISLNAQWVEQSSGVTGALYSVSAIDENVAWIGAASGVVLRTTNGGTNWTNVGGGVIGTAAVYNVWGIDANNALCTTSPAATFVYKTTDGGTSWTQVFTQTGGFIDAIMMTSATDGFMYGDPVGGRWSLWRTTNAGTTWDSTGLFIPQAGTEAGWNNAMYIMGNRIWFGTNNTKVYYSTNSGALWTAQTTTGQLNSYAVCFDGSFGLAGGTQLVSSTNYGSSWNAMTSLGTANISGIIGAGNYWFFVRQSTALYGSTNSGTNWTQVYTARQEVIITLQDPKRH
jgi:photosystem II stability/assembly factor-like uncharacterized protein